MTRPTAASAGHKAGAVKSPPPLRTTGGLGRMGSVRSKAGGATDSAKRKIAAVGAKPAEKKQTSRGNIVEEGASTEVSS